MSKKRNVIPGQSPLLFTEEERNNVKIDNPPPRTSSAPSPEAYQRYQRDKSVSMVKSTSPGVLMSPVAPSSPRMSNKSPKKVLTV